jgi:hypothetical protein
MARIDRCLTTPRPRATRCASMPFRRAIASVSVGVFLFEAAHVGQAERQDVLTRALG